MVRCRRRGRARVRARRSARTGTPTRSRWPSTAPSRLTRRSTPASTTWSRACASAPVCPCRGSTSSTTRRRMPSRPGAIRRTPPSPSPPGLLEKMNRIELEGVLAHELSHIKNYDILVSTLAVVMVGAIALLSELGIRFMIFGGGRNRSSNDNGGNPIFAIIALVFIVLAPIAATLMQFAVSRRREALADISADRDHALSAGPDLRPREAAGRSHRRAREQSRHRASLDRRADGSLQRRQ